MTFKLSQKTKTMLADLVSGVAGTKSNRKDAGTTTHPVVHVQPSFASYSEVALSLRSLADAVEIEDRANTLGLISSVIGICLPTASAVDKYYLAAQTSDFVSAPPRSEDCPNDLYAICLIDLIFTIAGDLWDEQTMDVSKIDVDEDFVIAFAFSDVKTALRESLTNMENQS